MKISLDTSLLEGRSSSSSFNPLIDPLPTKEDNALAISEEELYRKLLTYLEASWWQIGEYPPAKTLQAKYYVSFQTLNSFVSRLNPALKNRGLPPVEFSQPKRRRGAEKDFDELFILGCDLVCDTLDKRSTSKKLQTIDVTTKQWQAWLQVPEYKAYFKMRVEKAFGDTNEVAKLSLTKNVESGDLQSIKHFHELTNVYRPNQQTLLNLGVLIGRLMEILPKYVSGEQLVALADEFETVLAIETTAKELS